MAKIIPITEHFQHFLAELKESFWGDVYGRTQLAWKQFLEADSELPRDRYAVREAYQRRRSRRQPYRNGYYERDFVTRLGTIRLRVARTRGKSFLPPQTGAVSAPGGRGAEVRRRTRHMVCFVNVESVDRIIYSILPEIQSGMENPHPLPIYTSSLTSPDSRD
jgi:hypothetical protein